MWSLHAVTDDIRELFKWGVIGLIALIILISIFNLLKGILFKPKPIGPTMYYGILPSIPFPKSAVSQQLTYTLDTINGKVSIIDPTTNQAEIVPTLINVYKIIHPQPSLTSLQDARDKALAAGFVDPSDNTKPVVEQRITDTLYQWSTNDPLSRSLTMDINTYNFHIISQYLTNPAVLSATNVPSDQDALSQSQNLITSMNILPDDLDSSLTKTTDYVIENSIIRPAQANENVMAVKTNFFQNAINGYTIYYPNFPDSTMNILITGGDTASQVAQATFVHHKIDMTSGSTYPLKTPDQAYAELEAGNGYITPSFTGSNSVDVRTVNLGYYLGETDQDYLMPIYIFQGGNNFTAYVSAINDALISTASATPTDL
ncbi:MAG TPA: hypothetical protein VMR41_03685 [Patescibacteria group bacterium]|nr:hypothetical protein [Patescibacteria group bacterium]